MDISHVRYRRHAANTVRCLSVSLTQGVSGQSTTYVANALTCKINGSVIELWAVVGHSEITSLLCWCCDIPACMWPCHRVLIRGYWRHLISKQPSCRTRWTTSPRHRIHWRNTAAGCHRSKPVTTMNCWKFQVFCHDNMHLFSYLHCLNVCFKVVLIFCNI